jgi:glycosyltransferase involved in cell wall biosynthesis
MPFFSVIIPLYNKEKYIENTLKSIFNQTFIDYEIIIIEDCSTDNSLEIVKAFKSDKIRIVQHDKNKGLSASRNTGIKNASANYVAFLDADDIWNPTYLEKIHSLINQFPEAKLFGTLYEELYPKDVAVLPQTNLKDIEQDVIIDDFFSCSLAQPIYCCCSLCVDKSVFDEVGYFNERITFGEDVDFNIRANAAFKLAYSKKALVTYTMFSENQITNTSLKNKTITDFDAYETLATETKNLKKYLDFNRYIMAKHYKMEGDWENFNKLKKGIIAKNINLKQRLLLNTPLFILKFIRTVKNYFIKKGLRVTTY